MHNRGGLSVAIARHAAHRRSGSSEDRDEGSLWQVMPIRCQAGLGNRNPRHDGHLFCEYRCVEAMFGAAAYRQYARFVSENGHLGNPALGCDGSCTKTTVRYWEGGCGCSLLARHVAQCGVCMHDRRYVNRVFSRFRFRLSDPCSVKRRARTPGRASTLSSSQPNDASSRLYPVSSASSFSVRVSFVVVAVVRRLRSQVVAPIVVAREGLAMTHAVFCCAVALGSRCTSAPVGRSF